MPRPRGVTATKNTAQQLAAVKKKAASSEPVPPTIDEFRAEWSMTSHKGRIDVRVVDTTGSQWGYLHTLSTESPAEMVLLLQLLRDEKPVHFDKETSTVTIGEAPELPPT